MCYIEGLELFLDLMEQLYYSEGWNLFGSRLFSNNVLDHRQRRSFGHYRHLIKFVEVREGQAIFIEHIFETRYESFVDHVGHLQHFRYVLYGDQPLANFLALEHVRYSQRRDHGIKFLR